MYSEGFSGEGVRTWVYTQGEGEVHWKRVCPIKPPPLESRGGTLPTSDFRLPTSDFRLPTSDFRLPT